MISPKEIICPHNMVKETTELTTPKPILLNVPSIPPQHSKDYTNLHNNRNLDPQVANSQMLIPIPSCNKSHQMKSKT